MRTTTRAAAAALGAFGALALGALLVAPDAGAEPTPTGPPESPPAAVATASVSITCTSWSLTADNYVVDPERGNNTWSIALDGRPFEHDNFGSHFGESGTFPAGSGNHALLAYVRQSDDPADPASRRFYVVTHGCPKIAPTPTKAPTPTPTPTKTVPASAPVTPAKSSPHLAPPVNSPQPAAVVSPELAETGAPTRGLLLGGVGLIAIGAGAVRGARRLSR